MVDAQRSNTKWPGIFQSTTDMVLFGSPFRGAGGPSQIEMIQAAQSQYEEDQVHGAVLNIFDPGNESLDLTADSFETRQGKGKAYIACFFEQKSSNVGTILHRSRIKVSRRRTRRSVMLIEKKMIRSRRDFWLSRSERVNGEIIFLSGSFWYEQVRTTRGGRLPDGVRGGRIDGQAIGRPHHNSEAR